MPCSRHDDIQHAGSAADLLDRLGRRDDADALVRSAQIEQVPVAGDDQIGPGGEGASEYMVICGVIGYDRRHFGRRHQHHQRPIADGQRRGRRAQRAAIRRENFG